MQMWLLQLIIAAAPMVGWGPADLAAFAASPPRLGVVLFAFVTCVVVASRKGVRGPFSSGESGPSPPRAVLLGLGIMAVPVLFGWLAYADRHQVLVTGDSRMRYAGLAMYGIGEAVRVMALGALGRLYSAYVTIQHDHVLIRHGIYRVVRHPIYLAQLLTVPGVALAFRSWIAAPLLLVSVLFVARRITHEEDLLARTFPREYEEYRHQSWRLVPFLY